MKTLVSLAVMWSMLFAGRACPAGQGAEGRAREGPVAGHWLGVLNASGVPLRLSSTIKARPDGMLEGTLNSLDQDGVAYPLDEVAYKDRAVRLVLKRSGIVYEGKLNAGDTAIEGKFTQRGVALPLSFTKLDRPPEPQKRPQVPKRPFPYREEPVTFEDRGAGAKFAGTLTLPRSAGPHPCALLITGSGQQDRDEMIRGHRPFLVLADFLTRRGVAVLRVDDRGVGGSTGDLTKATTRTFADDALAAVVYLKTRPEIDPRRIGLIGHSEGGTIACMIAARPDEVAWVVLWGMPGLPGKDILYLQQDAVLKAQRLPESFRKKSRTLQETLYMLLEKETDAATLDREMTRAADDFRASLGPLEKLMAGSAVQPAAIRKTLDSPWFRFFLQYDPRPTLAQVRCPVLALYGEKDIQVSPRENLPEIEKALRSGGNGDVTVRELPKLNHLLQTCQTGNVDEYARIEETIAPTALDLIADWVRRQAGLAP